MITERVEGIIKEPLEAEGYSIVRIRFDGMNKKTLQIMLDKKDGSDISINDCTKASKMISTLFIVDDPITEEYNLEVSSAGIDRPLVKKEDFVRFAGRNIRLKTKHKIDDQYKFKGVLKGIKEEEVLLEIEGGGSIEIDFDNVLYANLDVSDKLFNSKSREKI